MKDTLINEVKTTLSTAMKRTALDESVTENTNIATDIGIDSVQMINFFLLLEDRYDIAFDYESIEIENFTLGHCCELIEQLRQE